jgi:hypothetical protein
MEGKFQLYGDVDSDNHMLCGERYACFGYTIDNAELLRYVKEGDVVVDAKVLKGGEKLRLKGP